MLIGGSGTTKMDRFPSVKEVVLVRLQSATKTTTRYLRFRSKIGKGAGWPAETYRNFVYAGKSSIRIGDRKKIATHVATFLVRSFAFHPQAPPSEERYVKARAIATG